MSWKERFEEAYKADFITRYPHGWKDGHYISPKFPDVKKSNGLTRAITSYLHWIGAYGNRINTMGRLVEGSEKTASGMNLKTKKWIPSTTKRGTPDIDAIISGVAVKFEVKIGRDVQSDQQIRQQAAIERAGGKYFIIKTIEDFYSAYDTVILSRNTRLFD
jgi:hypothetical protein